jgi:hypothetical protein
LHPEPPGLQHLRLLGLFGRQAEENVLDLNMMVSEMMDGHALSNAPRGKQTPSIAKLLNRIGLPPALPQLESCTPLWDGDFRLDTFVFAKRTLHRCYGASHTYPAS